MNAQTIKAQVAEMASHILFSYAGRECGVDPLAQDHYDMWFGSDSITVDSIDEVMQTPLFDGRSLSEIAPEIQVIN